MRIQISLPAYRLFVDWNVLIKWYNVVLRIQTNKFESYIRLNSKYVITYVLNNKRISLIGGATVLHTEGYGFKPLIL